MKLKSNEKYKILIICTGNSCRSQMAEGFARNAGWQVLSAGIKPEIRVNPFAVKVMLEMGIDISHHTPQIVDKYLSDDFYLVATVCDYARETCPVFNGSCEYQIHHDFKDPAKAKGSDKEITEVYRQVRDNIRDWIENISNEHLNSKE